MYILRADQRRGCWLGQANKFTGKVCAHWEGAVPITAVALELCALVHFSSCPVRLCLCARLPGATVRFGAAILSLLLLPALSRLLLLLLSSLFTLPVPFTEEWSGGKQHEEEVRRRSRGGREEGDKTSTSPVVGRCTNCPSRQRETTVCKGQQCE